MKIVYHKQKLKANCNANNADDLLIVPVVMIVEGVLNGALLTLEEYSKNFLGWNGRPVVVGHPSDEVSGTEVSANATPEQAAKAVGAIYNTRIENGKLMADAYISSSKLCAAGYCKLATDLSEGATIEVSTSYFCDEDLSSGEFKGTMYSSKHKNLVPDHLALLPDAVGACSIEDGCGTFRKNQQTNNEGNFMKIKALRNKLKAHKLKANELSAEQIALLESLTEEQVDALLASFEAPEANLSESQLEKIEALDEGQLDELLSKAEELLAPADNADEDEDEEDEQKRIDKMVANANKRYAITSRLVANEHCAFSEKELDGMPLASLAALDKQMEKSKLATNNSHDTDFSGLVGGGFSPTSPNTVIVNANNPTLSRGLMGRKKGAK